MSPKIRESLYYVGTIIPALLGLGMIWGGIDAGAASSIGDILAGALALIGATAPATAAVKVNKQRKDGTLEPLAPVDQVVNGVQAVIAAQHAAQAELDRVKDAVTGAIGVIPGVLPQLGPLAQQAVDAVNAFPTAYSQVPQFTDYRQPWDR
ncbi:holin [Mycobacterium phage LHTSCC]|uniref:Holin n=5 Tax=Backyardiganvirus TaxID=2946815 RepID=W0LNM0_9CAUD|nr:holin [Mycobacterium phage Obama12]YP_009018794.1 holin [Mycobacterium phage LHTSCC]YP_009190868.1 holin [Mycobacterium phage Iracema64]YP_010062482.1 holin [Mycobacterium phage Cerulean]YP_010062824.1 holin [Mycobacterium phage Camperdownii]AQP31003.1 holin [Mycobacterium phage Tinybot]AXQ63100.1 holin [Mycobacterium phage ChampagnePapi]QBP29211.1 holin [Mycobacterium phage Phighter1804]QDF16092.1 holin [Mycobacterium phage SheldonCooper]QPL14215.1 holin [Mycobacterium phage BangNhom]